MKRNRLISQQGSSTRKGTSGKGIGSQTLSRSPRRGQPSHQAGEVPLPLWSFPHGPHTVPGSEQASSSPGPPRTAGQADAAPESLSFTCPANSNSDSGLRKPQVVGKGPVSAALETHVCLRRLSSCAGLRAKGQSSPSSLSAPGRSSVLRGMLGKARVRGRADQLPDLPAPPSLPPFQARCSRRPPWVSGHRTSVHRHPPPTWARGTGSQAIDGWDACALETRNEGHDRWTRGNSFPRRPRATGSRTVRRTHTVRHTHGAVRTHVHVLGRAGGAGIASERGAHPARAQDCGGSPL